MQVKHINRWEISFWLVGEPSCQIVWSYVVLSEGAIISVINRALVNWIEGVEFYIDLLYFFHLERFSVLVEKWFSWAIQLVEIAEFYRLDGQTQVDVEYLERREKDVALKFSHEISSNYEVHHAFFLSMAASQTQSLPKFKGLHLARHQ